MTIYAYTGTVGTGKSLHAASEIRWQLNRPTPRPVLANFKLNPKAEVKHREMFTYCPNHEMTVPYLQDYANNYWKENDFREDYINLVIDEAQLIWNSRLWSAKDRMQYLEFMSQSRKYGYKVILIAQSAKMIDNQFRMLIEYEVNHRKVSNMGIMGGLLGMITANRLFMYVEYLFQTNERIGSNFYIAKKKDFDMYDSYSRFERVDDKEVRLQPETI